MTVVDPEVVAKTGAVLVTLVWGVMLTKLLPVNTVSDDSAPMPRWFTAFKSAQPLRARIADPIAELK